MYFFNTLYKIFIFRVHVIEFRGDLPLQVLVVITGGEAVGVSGTTATRGSGRRRLWYSRVKPRVDSRTVEWRVGIGIGGI